MGVRDPDSSARRQQLLRSSAAVVLILLVIAIDVLLRNWLITLPQDFWIAFDGIIIATIGLFGYLMIERTLKWRQERRLLEHRLDAAENMALEASQRQALAFRISQIYSEVSDEAEVIDLILQQSQQVVGARGASFVSLDERAQPLAPVNVGEMPAGVTDAWLEYLASPAVRQRCSSCSQYGHTTIECPLLGSPRAHEGGIFCLPFTRGEQQYGTLNLFLADEAPIREETQAFLYKIIAEATLAFEGIRLRNRELLTLREIQLVREKTDLNGLLSKLLSNLNETLEADYSQVSFSNERGGPATSSIAVGYLPSDARHLVDDVLQTVVSSSKPVVLGDISAAARSSPGVRALMAAPLIFQDDIPLGAILVASLKLKAFTPRQLSMLQTVSSQVALVVRNVSLMTELEYNTILAERARLAREIHDGLAQTLAYLKLKMAQLKNYVDQGDRERLSETLSSIYNTLADAYGEVRGAIDGLRVVPDDEGIEGWLRQIAADYQENSGIAVEFCNPFDNVTLPPEVQVQLIRIIQEALNNIRKHAGGSRVWVSCREVSGDLVLEVRDDGKGFDIEDIPGPSRYGLQGMRERAELVGADFQVISQPLQGTLVRVRLPLEYVGDVL